MFQNTVNPETYTNKLTHYESLKEQTYKGDASNWIDVKD